MEQPGIVVVDKKMAPAELKRLVEAFFEDMVKYVADAETLLLGAGSRQTDLWGANYFPGLGREQCIEYTSLINIRPAHGNRAMEIESPAVRERVRALTFALLGEGEPLP